MKLFKKFMAITGIIFSLAVTSCSTFFDSFDDLEEPPVVIINEPIKNDPENPIEQEPEDPIIEEPIVDDPTIDEPIIEDPVIIEEPTIDLDAWTIMIYICGADLESDYYQGGLATSDLKEILSVSGQPEDVNIVIETGGAKSWKSTYGISSTKLERWHVFNKKLVKDDSLTYASMGLPSTLQSFIEYGLTEYPAEKTALILWNHGGGMDGVCYDEKKNNDSLLGREVVSALNSAFTKTGRTDKLEWIGYDACLMQVQDLAEMNSTYFNYMIASQESEDGYGWDYDTWIDDLYAKKSTDVILKAITDGFIKSVGSSSDQTMSYLNLSYAKAYKNAWENMATAIKSKITSRNRSNFSLLAKSAKEYAKGNGFGVYDAKDFINKLASNSTFNPGSEYTNAILNIYSNLVVYSKVGSNAGNSNGLSYFFNGSSISYSGGIDTNFSNWASISNYY